MTFANIGGRKVRESEILKGNGDFKGILGREMGKVGEREPAFNAGGIDGERRAPACHAGEYQEDWRLWGAVSSRSARHRTD